MSAVGLVAKPLVSEPVAKSTAAMPPSADSLVAGFLRSAELYESRPALALDGESLTYGELYHRAASIARSLLIHKREDTGLTAVFASRSISAYAGVLGSLMAGDGYVPLNSSFPLERTLTMLDRAGCASLVAGSEVGSLLPPLLDRHHRSLLIILPEDMNARDYTDRWRNHKFVNAPGRDLQSSKCIALPSITSQKVAYLLFTSGSTGIPKGVGVTHSNVKSFIAWAADHYQVTEYDRLSQTFDLTFDLSVFDMFVAWERGACLSVPSKKALLNPRNFIRDQKLTIWFSVPSLAVLMKRLHALAPSSFPSLRFSLFCGEALPHEIASAWAQAAPNSKIENLYGPTEATIACMAYRVAGRSEQAGENGIVPIGYPIAHMKALVVDEKLCEVQPGAKGELLISGPQVTPGYWRDADRTAIAFVIPPGERHVYYRTGDYVRKPLGTQPIQFLGRLDNQVKIQGYRVELQEVEAILRQVAKVDSAVAVAWPVTAGGAGGVEAFLQGDNLNLVQLRQRLAARLPPYAVPRRIHQVPTWPLNANGKIDRKELVRQLEAQA